MKWNHALTFAYESELNYISMAKDPDSLTKHLQIQGVDNLIARCQVLESLNILLQQMLPAPLNQQVKVINLKQNTLIIGLPSASWLQRAQFSEAQLLQQLQFHPNTKQITRLHWKVVPELNIPIEKPKKKSSNTKLTDTAKSYLEKINNILK